MNKQNFWIHILLFWLGSCLVVGAYKEFRWLIYLIQHTHFSFS